MRVVAFPAVLLLALGTLALVPPAAADAPPHCPGYDTVGTITVVVRLTGDTDCTQHVYLIPSTYCSGLLDGTVHEAVGYADVWVPHCGPDLTTCIQQGTCDPPLGAASADPACTIDPCPQLPDGCPEKTETLKAGGGTDTVTTNADCTITLETGKGQICVGAWYETVEHQVGPVHWTEHRCTFPGGDPLCCLTATSAAAPDAIPPCQCPPIAPLCQPINRALAPGDSGPVTYVLSDYCHLQVIIDVSDTCGLQGTEWTNRTVNPVEVDYHHCQSPPPQSATSSIDPFPECLRQCLPLPDNCALRDATPAAGPSVGPITPLALRQAIWGNDCYIDVDPIGACAPPSGTTITRTIGPVRLTLLLCDGGIPPVVA